MKQLRLECSRPWRHCRQHDHNPPSQQLALLRSSGIALCVCDACIVEGVMPCVFTSGSSNTISFMDSFFLSSCRWNLGGGLGCCLIDDMQVFAFCVKSFILLLSFALFPNVFPFRLVHHSLWLKPTLYAVSQMSKHKNLISQYSVRSPRVWQGGP